MAGPNVIEAAAVQKAFGSTLAVRGADLVVRAGEVWGLVGPNGAGKTTLMRILSTLLPPSSGEVRILGHDLRTGEVEIRRRLGFLPDFFNLCRDLTVAECLTFFAYAYTERSDRTEQVRAALETAGLDEQRDSVIRHLSRGMVQRLGLAVLLVRDADVLVMDEPASGLDPRARVDVRNVLRSLGREGRTVLVSSHILGDLDEICTHVAVMDRGRIIRQGRVDEILDPADGRRRFRFRILGDTEAARGVAAGVPGVGAALRVEDGHLEVAAEGEDAVARVNAALVARGIGVAGIEEIRTRLEDVFLQATRAPEDAS